MNIALIGDYRSIHLQRWVNYFVNKNYHVTVLSDHIDNSVATHLNQLKFVPLLKKNGNSKLSTYLYIRNNRIFLARILKERKIKLLHCHYTNFYGWLGYLSGFHPIIQTIWGSDLMIPGGLIDRYLNQRSWKNANKVTVHSQYMEDKLKNCIHNHENISLIRWGVDLEKFKPGKKNPELLK